MQRLRSRGTSLLGSLAVPQLKRRAIKSIAAIQDTFFLTKDIFERHRVVFTVGTSIASVATAWAGYSLRHLHDTKVDQRLESIEKVLKSNEHVDHAEFKKLVGSGSSRTSACVATAGTTLVMGYALGWKGGRWYANRKFKQEQMKLLGQIKPKRWQLFGKIKPKGWQFQLLRRSLAVSRVSDRVAKTSEKVVKDSPITCNSRDVHQSC